MTRRKPIGFNIRLRYVKDISTLRKRLVEMEPAWCVLCIDRDDHFPYLEALAKEHPDIKFIARVVDVNPDVGGTEPRDGKWHLKPDDDRKYLCSPVDFLTRWGHLGKNGLTLNVSNEPNGYVDEGHPDNLQRLADWTLELLKEATRRSIQCCVLNFATGHPIVSLGPKGPEWIMIFDEVLRYVSEHRDQLVGIHEYLPGVGADNRVGRIGAMVNRCAALGIQPPRVLITEYGVDSDMRDHQDGYKSRNWPGDFYAHQLYNQVETTYRPYIQAGILEGLAVFVYGE